jgi:hypothetical protein
MIQVQSETPADGLYAMVVENVDGVRCLGGPFLDIDDVLDACFDEMMARDCGPEDVFYVERSGGKPRFHRFPKGAFPTPEEVM